VLTSGTYRGPVIGSTLGEAVPVLSRMLVLIVFFGALATAPGVAGAGEALPFWKEVQWPGTVTPPAQAAEYKIARFDLELLNSPVIAFPLPEGGVIHLVQTKDGLKKFDGGGIAWTGKVKDDDRSIATFSRVGKVMVGDVVTSNGKMYRVSNVAGDIHLVARLLPGLFPNEARSALKSNARLSLSKPLSSIKTVKRSCERDSPNEIDVLVAYTEGACAGANGNVPCTTPQSHDGIQATIIQAVTETNQTYANSSVAQRLFLVPAPVPSALVSPYSEASTIAYDLLLLSLSDQAEAYEVFLTLDPALHKVHDLRDQLAADVVVLLTKPRNAYPNCDGSPDDPDCPKCGVGPSMEPNAPVPPERAYVVVPLDCATGHFSFGHELGHLMGANHDVSNSPPSMAFPHSHGHISIAGPSSWRTVMAYQTAQCLLANPKDKGGCIRLPLWSNGSSTGAPGVEDNVLSLTNTAADVANNRRRCDVR
jgi:hypothetical protein